MNKKEIDRLIPIAYDALNNKEISIVKNNTIKKTYRGQISTFGAAITMGSLLAAIAYFSNDASGSSVERSKIMTVIFNMIKQYYQNINEKEITNLFKYVRNSIDNAKGGCKKDAEDICREQIINSAIALKLAMGLFTLVDDKEGANGQ